MARLLRYGAALFAALACSPSESAGPSGERVRATDSGVGGFLNAGDSAGSGTSVRVVLGEPSVCPGQCTEVSAAVDGPGDYRYTWTPTLPSGPGPYTLCPSETTRVEVKVVHRSVEFSSAPLVAAETLKVSGSCSDARSSAGGAQSGSGGTQSGSGGSASGSGGRSSGSGGSAVGPIDAGLDGSGAAWPLDEPSCVTHLACSSMQVLDMGGDSSTFVVGMFKGTLSVGALTLTSTASVSDGFVVRVDPGCKVVWARSLPGASRTIPYQVATGPDGNVVVTGSFDGYVDFGAGVLLSGPFRNVFVAELDRGDGHVIWNRQYGTTEVPGSNQGFTSLAVAANGDIAFTGFGNRSTDFGGGPMAPSAADAQVVYVAKLDSSGGYRFARSLPLRSASSALHPDGTLAVAGLAYGAFTWGATQFFPPGGASNPVTDVVAQLDAQGAAQGASVRPGTQEGQSADGSEGLATTSDGTLYRAEGRIVAPNVFGYATAIWSPGAASPVVGEVTVEYPADSLGDADHRLSVDGSGALFAASQYGSDRPVGGRMLGTVGARDAIVLRVNRAGIVDWGGHYGTANDEADVHVHATPAEGVFIAGYELGAPGAFLAQFNPR